MIENMEAEIDIAFVVNDKTESDGMLMSVIKDKLVIYDRDGEEDCEK